MNIARVEYYFAEFLSLLELPDADKRQLSVVTDEWERDPVTLRQTVLALRRFHQLFELVIRYVQSLRLFRRKRLR